MEVAHLVAFNLTLLAAMAAPGPALLIAMRNTVAGGRRAGIATGAGLATVAALWTLAALSGLDVIFTILPAAYAVMKAAGAAYLLWIAYRLWRGAGGPVEAEAAPSGRAFRSGALVNLGNPKSILFAASVLVVIFPADLSAAETALIVANHLVVELAVYAALALALSGRRAQAGYLAAKPVLDRVAAAVLGALGLRLLLHRGAP
ncbi:MAG: LysE family translocator [Paracoccaceae bacterium]